jgi:protocatechuate 3,4-dioxygenase beta subunit
MPDSKRSLLRKAIVDDDTQVGHLLSRREAMMLLGAGVGAGMLPSNVAFAAPQCVVRPQQIEGPYFADVPLNRSDIRSDPKGGPARPGVPLDLSFVVSRLRPGCAPLAGARVDIWHCDALGFYSNVADPSFDTSGQFFLRGYQVTDAGGLVRFRTIYPGWYEGRATHIHFKLRTESAEFTSQLYFRDSLTDKVHALAPYTEHGRRVVRNRDDNIYGADGRRLLLAPVAVGEGYAAELSVALDV